MAAQADEILDVEAGVAKVVQLTDIFRIHTVVA